MIYITQLVYIKKGQENIFHEFESIAMPLIARYNGKLLLRTRLEQTSVIEATIDIPYEFHFISFESPKDLENFMKDDERKKYIHLKEQSIEKVLLVSGSKM